MNHTPGPWICHSGMVWKSDGSANGIPIARMDRDTPHTEPTERDRNAHLIASAPDLLAALETMVSAFNANQIDPLVAFAAIERARSAIDKAKGKL